MLLVALVLALPACEIPIPASRCVTARVVGDVLKITECDAGAAGISGAGAGGRGGVGGLSGTGGVSGRGGAGGMGGSVATAGMGGSAGAEHVHGGLPVTLPLPEFKAGRQDKVLVSAGGRVPVKDDGGIGAFRTRCYVSHENFDDAIVYPGQPGKAHLHQYAGADEITAGGIAPTAGGTCRGGAVNLSAYWWPGLLTPAGKVLRPMWADIYYKASAYDISGTPKTTPPPKGLKVVAGDMTARESTPQNRNRFYWSCGETDGGAKPAGLPSGCTDSVIGMHTFFPPCWDGARLDSPDHKAHMAYPVNGACPATHKVLLPTLSYHVYWRNVPAGSRLSCDAATGTGGYCNHADWIANWDEKTIASGVNACVNTGLSCGSDLIGDGTSMGSFGGN